MTQPQIAPYGSWKSPITSDLIISDSIGLSAPRFDGDHLYWLEHRPQEAGRVTIIQRMADGQSIERSAAPFNVRTRVHEYGGGAYTVADGVVYFCNFSDQRVYRQSPGGTATPITPATELRYADFCIDSVRNLLFCVREDHRQPGEAINTIARVRCAGDEQGGEIIAGGNDFYSSPRLSPDGRWLAWLSWNHPNMPWDGCELWLGELDASGGLLHAEQVAGGVDESIFQPQWSPDGVLHFVSDRSGWWNLYRWRDGRSEALYPMAAEFGLPQWVFEMSTYAFRSASELVCAYTQNGVWRLATLDTTTQQLTTLPIPYTTIDTLSVSHDSVLFLAASPTHPRALVTLDLASKAIRVIQQTSSIQFDPGYISVPQVIEFPTEDGLTAHAFFYPPCNKDYAGPANQRPLLIVISHGGPTGATDCEFALTYQYWTSRGIAVLDVNYGGSTGYGRAYRLRLNGRWGVVDVDDCVNGARYLVAKGLVDEKRLMIRGGSAGGYTTLCALTFRNVFNAGASYFGVGDAEALAKDTHKFESRYLDNLLGPYPAQRDLYVARSPINFTDQISCPLILFQGDEDQVVPPEQSRKMFDSVKFKELPVAYLEFAGEQHGFRKAENIKRSLDAELYFYSKVFGFDLAEPVEPIQIENL